MENIDLMLCSTCKSNLGSRWSSETKVSTYSYRDLVTRKDLGCFICNLIWSRHPRQQIDGSVEEDTTEELTVTYYTKDRGHQYLKILHCKCSSGVTYETSVLLSTCDDVYCRREPNLREALSIYQDNILAQPWSKLNPYIGSPQSFETIQSWISTCKRDHEFCEPRSDAGSYFPTRVIDVQKASSGKIFLCNRDEVIQTYDSGEEKYYPTRCPEYWTLSHRWGDPSRISQLLTTTEHQLRDGISLGNLSPTFRDAAILVHSLGYRYLWIDSLCIFQDLEGDWHREASTMNDIYRHSFCNISAISPSANPASGGGLFRDRIHNTRFLYPFMTSVPNDIYEPNLWIAWNDSMWVDEIENAPLHTRGWVVQERFLPNRTIYFTRSQIFWDCLGCVRCEADSTTSLINSHSSVRDTKVQQTLDFGYKAAKLAIAQAKARRQHYFIKEYTFFWLTILSTYLSCTLTKESDRLIALSGIAKAFQEVNRDTYIAGLWKYSIHYCLLWKTKATSGTRVQRNKSYGPSWSWASVAPADAGAAVEIWVPKWETYVGPLMSVTKERIVTDPPGGDPTGFIQYAELDIEYRLCYFRWIKDSHSLEIYNDEARSQLYKGFRPNGQVIFFDLSVQEEEFKDVPIVESICIPVCDWTQYQEATTYWLILVAVEDKFKRIGIIECKLYEPGYPSLSLTRPNVGRSSCITLI
ncbi:HET-domain-containing protein [Annulohypoxylon nitens]|nr:HET-domain-containing protein [Annulohypoxylon nitens]